MASKNSRSAKSNSATTPAQSSPVRAEKVDLMAQSPSATPAVSTSKPAAAVEVKPAAVATATPVVAATAPVAKAAIATPAAVVAEKSRDRSSVIALIALLHDQDAEVARDAAASLGRLPVDAEAVKALCAILTNADGYFHSVVRAAAAASLGQLGDRSAVDALIHATGDTMAEASEEAIKSLGILGDRRALSALTAVIRNDHGFFLESVRRAAQDSERRIHASAAKA